MLDCATEFTGMIQDGCIFFIQSTRGSTAPEAVPQSSELGTHVVFDKQKARDEIGIVERARRCTNAFRRSACIFQFFSHLPDCLRKALVVGKPAEKDVGCRTRTAAERSISA